MILSRKYYTILFILLGVFAVSGINAQMPAVTTKIDTHQIVIGDQTRLQYDVTEPKGSTIQLPFLQGEFLEGVEVVGNPLIDSIKQDNEGWLKSLQYNITSFDTGMYYIPPMPFLVKNGGVQDTLYSPATYLEVLGVAVDSTNTIRDIKATESMPVTIVEVLKWVFPIGLLIGLVIFLLWYYKHNRKEDAAGFVPLKPTEPAYITALRELDKLKAKKLWQQKQDKEYYSQITHIIRWYIEQRYHIDALEQTSDEILSAEILKVLDKNNFENLGDLLNLADLVKFAKGEPTAEQNIQHLENAYNFVKQTREEYSESTEEIVSTDN